MIDLVGLSQASMCRLITLAPDREKGSRLGGKAPAGIKPVATPEGTHYFMTLVLRENPHLECSLFIQTKDNILEAPRHLLFRDERIQMVRHGPSTRGEGSPLDSWLSSNAIDLSEPISDTTQFGDTPVIRATFKIAGRPSFEKEPKKLMGQIEQIQKEGFAYFMQIAYPIGPHKLRGTWPFSDYGTLHLYIKPSFESDEICYFWQS